MIHKAKFQNFKALRDVEITFDSRLTVLVGPNGSGKTSVLQGMHSLSQLAIVSGNDPDVALPKLAEYLSIGAPENEFSARLEGTRPRFGEYSIAVDTTRSGWITGVLSVNKSDGQKHWNVRSQYHGGRWLNPNREEPFLPGDEKRFDITAFIRFSAGQLAAPTLISSNPPQVAKGGSGLAATLSHVKLKYPERFDAIIAAFRRVIPNIKDVRFDKERVPDTQYYGDILLVDYKGVEGVKASHVSSGTLFSLGLLTVALGPDSANVILLDDLDHGLHPKAQMELIAVFRNLINETPDLQIIATAHSPYILQRLEWNEVRVTELRDDGSAICAKLEDHPEVERWREAMTPGEFWSHIGDDWVKKLDKPQAEQPQPAATAP
jgi:predicted ATPase